MCDDDGHDDDDDDRCLTADEGPQVKSQRALQRLIGSAEGVEEEEAGGYG